MNEVGWIKPILLFIGAVVRTPAFSQHYDHIGENAANLAVIEALRGARREDSNLWSLPPVEPFVRKYSLYLSHRIP
jgi:hypothetical protein